jgi:hypothetical protein
MTVIWVVTPCSLVEVYRYFGGACSLHHQGDRPAQQPRGLFASGTPDTNGISVHAEFVMATGETTCETQT